MDKVSHLQPERRQSLTERVGRLGEKQTRTIADAKKYGRRRLGVIAAPVAAGLLVAGVVKSEREAGEYNKKVETCARVLTGHEVELKMNPETGSPMIPAGDYSEVVACQRADGDPELAERLVDEIQPVEAERQTERES